MIFLAEVGHAKVGLHSNFQSGASFSGRASRALRSQLESDGFLLRGLQVRILLGSPILRPIL